MFRIEVHHRYPQVEQKLDAILHKLNRMEKTMATDAEIIDALVADVQKQGTVVDGITALLTSVKTQLAEALKGEQLSSAAQAKLAAIMPLLEANTQKLSDAVVANTDAAPADPAPTASAFKVSSDGPGAGGGTSSTSSSSSSS